MDSHASHDDISKHLGLYWKVFGALMIGTIITVGVRYMTLPPHQAIAVALVIATLKASLVALFFMHLSNERKIIYWVLGITVVFFIVLMSVPLFTVLDKIVQRY